MRSDVDELWPAAEEARRDAVLSAARAGDLEAGLLAIEGPSDAARGEATRQLDAWGEETRAAGGGYSALRDALGRAGLRGDEEDYHAVDNSLLTRVVARRRGMPILVTAVWMLVGRRAGVLVHGLALPGHFAAEVDGRVIDPYSGGGPLDPARLAAMVARGGPASRAPATAAVVLARVLRNLHASREREGDAVDAHRTARLLAGLTPDDAAIHLAAARHAEAARARSDAEACYRLVEARFDGAPRESARAGLARLARWPAPN